MEMRCRNRLRFLSLFALMVFAFHLVAMEVGRGHAIERVSSSAGAVEICTPYGIIWITAEGVTLPDGPDNPNSPGTTGQICPFCASAGIPLPLLLTAASLLLPPEEGRFFPSLGSESERSNAPNRRHAPPRAPPLNFFA